MLSEEEPCGEAAASECSAPLFHFNNKVGDLDGGLVESLGDYRFPPNAVFTKR